MRPRLSPAVLVLARHGISVAEVGRALPSPVERSYASMMLRGDYRLRPDVLPTIARLAGEDVAAEVARAVEDVAAEVAVERGRDG